MALCENRLIDGLEISNAVGLLELASFYFAAALRSASVNFICNHFEIISRSAEFEELPADTKEEIKRLKAL